MGGVETISNDGIKKIIAAGLLALSVSSLAACASHSEAWEHGHDWGKMNPHILSSMDYCELGVHGIVEGNVISGKVIDPDEFRRGCRAAVGA